MTQYYPDYWVVVNMQQPDDISRQRVFAMWSSGYSDGPAWKFSSEILLVGESEDRYEFISTSGSKYICLKSYYGINSSGQKFFDQMSNQLKWMGGSIMIDEAFNPANNQALVKN